MSNSGQALCTIRFLNFGRAGVGYDIVQRQLFALLWDILWGAGQDASCKGGRNR